MKTFLHRRPLLMLAAAAALTIASYPTAAQSLGASGTPTDMATGLPRSNVSELITFVPPTAQSVGFTDWGRIKTSQGAQDLSGASPIDDKLQVALSMGTQEATASAFGIAHLRDHYETWAFDTFDLDWEATIQGDGPPLFVLRFEDAFDLASVTALFDQRGFSTEQVEGATVRSHEMALDEGWLTATEFGILNTAFLDDGRTLVLSLDLDQVHDIAANHGRYPGIPGLDVTAAALAGASAALLVPGVGTCLGFAPLPIDVADPLASPDLSLPTSRLHPYAALGIGYGRPDWSPVGRITFAYLDPATASADLAGRLELATTGFSQRVRRPYADVLFQVADSRVDAANLTLDVSPVDDRPRLLFDMVFARDMLFAGC